MSKNNSKKLLLLVVLFILVSMFYYNQSTQQKEIYNSQNNLNSLKIEADNNLNREKEVQKIIVHLSGAVKKSGVYKLSKKDRVVDLIKAAGGLEKNADLEKINLAEKLFDGQKLIIPELKAKADLSFSAKKNKLSTIENNSILKNDYSFSKKNNLININQVDQSELEKLNGIGPAKAAAIIKYREEKGAFNQKKDLLKISGIGEKTLEKIEAEIGL